VTSGLSAMQAGQWAKLSCRPSCWRISEETTALMKSSLSEIRAVWGGRASTGVLRKFDIFNGTKDSAD
jgi:hypothetical protein